MDSKRLQSTIKGRILFFLFITYVVIALIGTYSIYQVYSYKQTTEQIRKKSDDFQKDVKKDFEIIGLLSQIESEIRAYLIRPSGMLIKEIYSNINRLKKMLGSRYEEEIEQLIQKVQVFSIRMHSLIANRKTMIDAENKMVSHLNSAHSLCATKESCIAILEKIDAQFLLYMKYSNQAVINSDEFNHLNNMAQSSLNNIIQILSSSHEWNKFAIYLKDIGSTAEELDEAIETVMLIRKKVLSTKGDVDKILSSLSAMVFNEVKKGINGSSRVVLQVLNMAQRIGLSTGIGLAVSAVLLVFFGVFLFTYIIIPLERFGKNLVDLSNFFTDTNKHEYKIQDYKKAISGLSTKRRDEIGLLAKAVKELATRVHDINSFRKIIEGDRNTDVIYERLASIFKDKLGFKYFCIMERPSSSQPGLQIKIMEPPDLLECMPEFTDENMCRAIRTGVAVSSLDFEGICKTFTLADEFHHICLPMIAGGQNMGVVCLLIEKGKDINADELEDRVAQALHLINEALPVLQAKRYASHLKKVALVDQMTGLFNRRYLDTNIDLITASIIRRQSHLGIMMCDMDYFKEVNDKYGHDAGDEVLKQLAGILKASVRQSDIVIRFGGEEFLILLSDCDPGKELDVAEKIKSAVENFEFRIPGDTILRKTISVGTSTFPYEKTKGIWEAIKFADIALYKAKEQGRNKVVAFEPKFWENKENY